MRYLATLLEPWSSGGSYQTAERLALLLGDATIPGRIWDHHEQRVCASVEWHPENTPFGFAVRTRRDVFQNPMLAVLARQVSERETMRESILAGVRLSA